MSLKFTIALTGLDALLNKLDAKPLLSKPIGSLLEKAGRTVQAKAQEWSPVDTGRLRASITTEIDRSAIPQFAQVFTMVEYAKFVEYGKGKPRGVGRIPFWRPAIAAVAQKVGTYLEEAKTMIERHWRF